ncbi:TIGR03086 family metal-binding protein [Sinosporangium siamense]|uniref:TIGR03086 family protein n=1 Tax=Sinosporangium siamense TaxID=1367973 RepID=A0A919RFX2_9ACTN|nr:TIGR03086 family metal-binding protein [Sinosporangium siamense]GII91664.1 TIGR03086 family protein [Sinosporangium siamense]
MIDIREAHDRALHGFGTRVHAIRDDQWDDPTPCTNWDVRTLVNHMVTENLWVPELLGGRTIAEVGSALDGDLLGDEPVKAFDASAIEATEAVRQEGVLDRTAHLSFGDVPAAEYLSQLFADALIHSWDLARAIGVSDRLDPELVEQCARWFADSEDSYRGAGVIGPRVKPPPGADAQAKLLGAFGRACA